MLRKFEHFSHVRKADQVLVTFKHISHVRRDG